MKLEILRDYCVGPATAMWLLNVYGFAKNTLERLSVFRLYTESSACILNYRRQNCFRVQRYSSQWSRSIFTVWNRGFPVWCSTLALAQGVSKLNPWPRLVLASMQLAAKRHFCVPALNSFRQRRGIHLFGCHFLSIAHRKNFMCLLETF